MRTEQDKINRKEANQRYYKLEENKQQKRDYMKSYYTRDYVKAKAHEYYVCLLYTSPSPRDGLLSRMPSSA